MVKKYLEVLSIKNLFFKRCYKCNRYFIKGFKILEYNKILRCNFKAYSCLKCNKSKEELLNKINRED